MALGLVANDRPKGIPKNLTTMGFFGMPLS